MDRVFLVEVEMDRRAEQWRCEKTALHTPVMLGCGRESLWPQAMHKSCYNFRSFVFHSAYFAFTWSGQQLQRRFSKKVECKGAASNEL